MRENSQLSGDQVQNLTFLENCYFLILALQSLFGRYTFQIFQRPKTQNQFYHF